jgi:hypothetical protein
VASDRAGAAADRARRSARPQHAALPAREGGGDGGRLGDQGRDAADPFRLAGRDRGDDARRSRSPISAASS